MTMVTCSFAVRENEALGTIVGEVFAEDIDTGTFGEIVYSISGFGSEKSVIEIIIYVITMASYQTACLKTTLLHCTITFIFSLGSFEINVTSGVISTSSQLDREQRVAPFNLLVTATDQDESVANRNQVSAPLVITGMSFNREYYTINPNIPL